jgi:hypothetical protein
MPPGWLLSLMAGLAAAWLAVGAFLSSGPLRLALALVFGICLGAVLIRRRGSHQARLAREQFKWFLELIITRLSSGATLERAIGDALPDMEQLLGRTAPFLIQLRAAVRQLEARGRSTNCCWIWPGMRLSGCGTFFQVLPELRRTGSQVASFVRQNLRMATEQLQLRQTVWAETAQRRPKQPFSA